MRPEFDPLRSTPLPDSFERTAAWLRSAPEPAPRPPRTRAALLAAFVVVFVAACSWPVAVTVPVASLVEAVSEEEDAGTLAARLFRELGEGASGERHAEIRLERAEGGAQVLRFAFSARRDPAAVAQWADSVKAHPSIRQVHVVRLDTTVRNPLGLALVRRALGLPPSPSEAEVASGIERALEAPPRIRILSASSFESFTFRTRGLPADSAAALRIDSLSREVAERLQRHAFALSLDSLAATSPGGARVLVLSRFLSLDSLRDLDLPPGFQVDTLRIAPTDSVRVHQLQRFRDSL
jgi:hypothetical protein